MLKRCSLTLVILLALMWPVAAQAQAGAVESTISLFQQVRTVPNIVYLRANGWEGKLDVYAQRTPGPTPTVIYIHGGGWVGGAKEASVLSLMPFLAMGYSVVNVEYRLANVSLAPAAIEDCRCALRWVVANAKEYGFDPDRLIVTGPSAGGHLALTTGMVPVSAGFDRICLTPTEPRVKAIVNFYGISDVADLLDGPNKKPFPENNPYTVRWLGNRTDRAEIARAASPMTYVRAGLPPVISIHGDADPTVPYNHSVKLHEALRKAGVPNELVTVPKGGHGGFPNDQWQRAYGAIQAFLNANGLGIARPPSTAASRP
jgi:acetyl esterase/lipase